MKCSKCGAETVDQIKAWPTVRISSKPGEASILTTGLYQCRSCRARFRAIVEKRKIDIKGAMDIVRKIESQLAQVTREKVELQEKVKALEGERSKLFEELETFKSVARTINRLEAEFMEVAARRAELEEKVAALIKEKEELLKTIEELKGQIELKELEAKAQALGTEVEGLREEEKSLREKLAQKPPEVTPAEQQSG
jgi:chromosome segregation ATPase